MPQKIVLWPKLQTWIHNILIIIRFLCGPLTECTCVCRPLHWTNVLIESHTEVFLLFLPSFRLSQTRRTLSMLQNVWLEDALTTLRSKRKCKSICLPFTCSVNLPMFPCRMLYGYKLPAWITFVKMTQCTSTMCLYNSQSAQLVWQCCLSTSWLKKHLGIVYWDHMVQPWLSVRHRMVLQGQP